MAHLSKEILDGTEPLRAHAQRASDEIAKTLADLYTETGLRVDSISGDGKSLALELCLCINNGLESAARLCVIAGSRLQTATSEPAEDGSIQ